MSIKILLMLCRQRDINYLIASFKFLQYETWRRLWFKQYKSCLYSKTINGKFTFFYNFFWIFWIDGICNLVKLKRSPVYNEGGKAQTPSWMANLADWPPNLADWPPNLAQEKMLKIIFLINFSLWINYFLLIILTCRHMKNNKYY